MQIHELPAQTTASDADVFAIDNGTSTQKITVANLGKKVTEDAIPAFTSGDEASPTAWSDVSVVTSGTVLKTILNRITTMMKNVRWLYSKLGTTDISSIADGTLTGIIGTTNISGIGGGTVTGAISKLNTDVNVTDYSASTTLDETAAAFKVYKTGNVVSGFFQGDGKARAESQRLFTLPAACRPKTGWFVIGYCAGVPMIIQINTNGQTIIYTASSYPTGRLYFNFTYTV